jgi:hypothetical protein
MHHRRHDGLELLPGLPITRQERIRRRQDQETDGEEEQISTGTCGCSSTKEDTGNWVQTRHRKRIDEANYRDGGTPSPSLIAKRRRRNHKVDQPMDAGRPLARRRTSRSWRGASVRRKTHVSTRRTGYADEADCTVVTSD